MKTCKGKNIAELVDDIRSDTVAKIRSGAKLMTLAETSLSSTIQILSVLAGDPMPRIILGITGAPGSGKSLLTGRLIEEFRKRYTERMIGVIAIDPSSPHSGGAILGDRIRMPQYADDDKVFIRSLATHGQVGGVTQGTRAVTAIMGALGCDIVLIETVGVGQMEFAVREVSDAVAIILAPGQGDTIQFLKAGLMEIGDLFVVNKSDRADSAQFYAQLLHSLQISDCARGRVINTPVFQTSARDNTGVSELFTAVEIFFSHDPLWWKARRLKQTKALVRRAILSDAQKRMEYFLSENNKDGMISEILEGKRTLSIAVDELLRNAK